MLGKILTEEVAGTVLERNIEIDRRINGVQDCYLSYLHQEAANQAQSKIAWINSI